MNPTARDRRTQARITAALHQIEFALPGSITERWTRCGRQDCRCKADPPTLHGPYLQWTRKQDGKTITRLLSDEQARHYRPLIEAGTRLRQLVRELETLTTRIVEASEGWHPPQTKTQASRTPKRPQ